MTTMEIMTTAEASVSDLMDDLYHTPRNTDTFEKIVRELLSRGVDVKSEALSYYAMLLRRANHEKTGRKKLIDRAERFSADVYYAADKFKGAVR